MVKLTCKLPTISNVSLIVLKHCLLEFNWYRAITQCTHPVNVLTNKLGIKIVRKRIPTRRSVQAFLQLWPNGWMDQYATWQRGRPRSRPHCVRWGPSPHSSPSPFSAHAYCGQTVAHLSNCWALVLCKIVSAVYGLAQERSLAQCAWPRQIWLRSVEPLPIMFFKMDLAF